MKTIIISILFIIFVIIIYNAVIGGEDGTRHQIGIAGNRMNSRIEQMSP